MEKMLLYSHIGCGAIVLILGFINMFNRKNANHALIGKIYVGAMWWICLSAALIISFYRFSFFLLVISVLTFYASFTGIRVMRRKTSSSKVWYDWAVSILTLLFGIGLSIYGIHIFVKVGGFHPLGLLSVIFGLLTLLPAYSDLRKFSSPKADAKMWWLQQHMRTMGGSYIAAITAFAVQNGGAFLPDDYTWLSWILPSMILSPVLTFYRKRLAKKFA